MTGTAGTGSPAQAYLQSEAHMQELIPGIPNEITLNHVTTKLPWRDVAVLSAVSHGWCHLVRSHHVYNVRVGSHSTETLILANWGSWIALCSLRDNSVRPLPRIAGGENLQTISQFVSVDCKIYVFVKGGRQVFVLDVIGQQLWKQCASLQNPKEEFECVVLGGKIYVFGRNGEDLFWSGPDVYDPKENTWSSIQRHFPFRSYVQVAAMGDELFAYSKWHLVPTSYERRSFGVEIADSLELYHPMKDEWRVEKSFGRHDHLVMAQGKLHSITPDWIKVYDAQGKTWADLHSFALATFSPFNFLTTYVVNVVAVDHEILACLEFKSMEKGMEHGPVESCMVLSTGFGSQNKELLWRKVEFCTPVGEFVGSVKGRLLYPIQL